MDLMSNVIETSSGHVLSSHRRSAYEHAWHNVENKQQPGPPSQRRGAYGYSARAEGSELRAHRYSGPHLIPSKTRDNSHLVFLGMKCDLLQLCR